MMHGIENFIFPYDSCPESSWLCVMGQASRLGQFQTVILFMMEPKI